MQAMVIVKSVRTDFNQKLVPILLVKPLFTAMNCVDIGNDTVQQQVLFTFLYWQDGSSGREINNLF